MTYKQLKDITTGLLVGDNVLPKDDAVIKGLLGYAFNIIATRAEALHLLTKNPDLDILRLAPGDYFTRTPNLPDDEDSELDIDDELVYVAAEIIASILSKNNKAQHERAIDRLIIDYNSKVYELLEMMGYTNSGVNS